MQVIKSAFYKIGIVAFLMSVFCARLGAQGISKALADTLQTALNSTRIAYNVKGISAAVYIPHKGMWKGVTGVSYATDPIDTTMLFSIGSITKTFVAAEIFKLIEGGSLSLSDTIGALLPPMPNVNPSITVKQLLGHTSGMGDFTNTAWQSVMFSDPTAIWYFPDALTTFCDPPAAAPGSIWHYCNANYSLLGMIIEAKKSDSLHNVLRNDFLATYHLNNTHMEVFESYANPIPHNWSTPSLVPSAATDVSSVPHQAMWSSPEPAGGYFSDPADLAMWGYNLYSGNVLSASSMADMLTFTPISSYFSGYGLGVMRYNYNSKTYYGHGGNYFGYAATMLYYPVDSICLAVLINQDCIAAYEARDMMNVLLKKLSLSVVDQAAEDAITVSPNPANTQLIIHIPVGNGSSQITISGVTGKEVYRNNARADILSVNTECFNTGMYFIRIADSDGVKTRQVQIMH